MFNMEVIKRNSRRVYTLMDWMYRYTFDEIERATKLECTDLCMALIELQKEGRIACHKDDSGVYYTRSA